MINTAYIIGQIGKAIYQENGRYFVIGIDRPKKPSECRSGDVSLLLDCSSDVLSISQPNLTLSGIEDILEEKTLSHKALVLVLSGLDEELSRSSRSLSVEAAESLLEQESVLTFLRARMLSRVLPPTADIRGAVSLANASGAKRVASLYAEVDQAQKAIQRLSEAWSQTTLILSLTDEESVEIERSLIDAGVFADVALTIATGDELSIRSTIGNCAERSALRSLSCRAEILNALQDRLLGKSANDSADSAADVDRKRVKQFPDASTVDIIKDTEARYKGKQADADLILKLYELRREATMREARNWFFTFNPTSVAEYMEAMMGPNSGYLRMVISYWDMAASLVNHGAIDEQMFNDANGEHLFVFAKIEPILADMRTQWNAPDLLKHYETLIRRIPDNERKLAEIRERIRMIQAMSEGAHAVATG